MTVGDAVTVTDVMASDPWEGGDGHATNDRPRKRMPRPGEQGDAPPIRPDVKHEVKAEVRR